MPDQVGHVQVSLVHQNVLPAEVFRPSLPKSGYISAKSAKLVHGIVVLRLSPRPSEACTLRECTMESPGKDQLRQKNKAVR